jgi:hypothetical protein
LWEDAIHWAAVYKELLAFVGDLIDRTSLRHAGSDLDHLMERRRVVDERLSFWESRVKQLRR